MNDGRIRITSQVMQAIIAHSQRGLPNESCGYLANENGILVRHYEMTNVDQAVYHYSMDPKEQYEAIMDARQRGQDLTAAYHSHPLTPAWPSNEDIRLAYDSELSYVIISLAGPEPVVRSFRIRDGVVYPEKIELIDEKV